MLDATRAPQSGRITRRVIRICNAASTAYFPPYYVALLFVLGSFFVPHPFSPHSQVSTDLSAGNILSHFLLLHNLWEPYNMGLDIPMWSVAWEWQIYFIFALLLLPIWQRAGMVCTVVTGFALGLLPMLLLPASKNFSWMSPWYLGLFTLGMAAAEVMSKPEHFHWIHSTRFQNRVLCVLAGSLLLIPLLRPLGFKNNIWIMDTIVGAMTALFILACTNKANAQGWRAQAVGILESKGLMWLGAFSYSLYLIHDPILSKMQQILIGHHIPHFTTWGILLVAGLPVCLLTSYLFHLAFERPFMPHHPRTMRQAECAALESPAP